MVLAGVCFDGGTELRVIDGVLTIAIRYMEDSVDPRVTPFAGAMF